MSLIKRRDMTATLTSPTPSPHAAPQTRAQKRLLLWELAPTLVYSNGAPMVAPRVTYTVAPAFCFQQAHRPSHDLFRLTASPVPLLHGTLAQLCRSDLQRRTVPLTWQVLVLGAVRGAMMSKQAWPQPHRCFLLLTLVGKTEILVADLTRSMKSYDDTSEAGARLHGRKLPT